MKKELITLGDIALKTGFSRMTISRALSNSSKVKKETAAKIQKAAKDMGYMPDARIAIVMAHIRGSKKKEPLPIAWLNTDKNRNAWHEYQWLKPFFAGATERCNELGYRLEEFWLHEPKTTAGRLSTVLYSRGIQGVVVTPASPSLLHLRLNWKHFSSVTFSKTLLVPNLHQVTPHHYYNMTLALKMMRRVGFRRIGLFMQAEAERRSMHMYLAAFRNFQADIPLNEHVSELIHRSPDSYNSLKSWLSKERPDAIVGHSNLLVKWLNMAGYRVPNDVGVAHLALDGDCSGWSGILQNKYYIGEQAIEQLVSMMHNNRLGVPQIAHTIMVPGSWRLGTTLLRRTG